MAYVGDILESLEARSFDDSIGVVIRTRNSYRSFLNHIILVVLVIITKYLTSKEDLTIIDCFLII